MEKPLYIHLSPQQRVFVDGLGVCIEEGRGSQLFGMPRIPAGVEVPTRPNPHYTVPYVSAWDGRTVETPRRTPLPFICRIDCREIPQEVTELPHDGELYFFAALEGYFAWGGDKLPNYASKDFVGVTYVPEDKFDTDRFNTDFARNFVPQSITLNFDPPAAEEPDHHLLGEPGYCERREWEELYKGWCLLLQLASGDGPGYHLNFEDGGVFNILISPEDLKNRDFSKVVGIVVPKK